MHTDLAALTRLTRREFVRAGLTVGAAAACGAVPARAARAAQSRALFAGIGITAALSRAPEIAAAGGDYIVPSVADFLMPDAPEEEFDRQHAIAAAAPLPVLGCNSFLRHPRLRCTGPDANHAAVLAFSGTAFHRLAKAGGRFIGFGSNTSRRIPDGWPKARADEQFVTLLREMGPLAAGHGITVSVEQLRTSECNYLNRLAEVAAIVSAVDHPNVRVLADLFHMAVMGDTAADLAAAMPWVGLVELAEKENRTPPGVAGDDFRPYFAALHRGGYAGHITIEANGTPEQIAGAFAAVARQAADVVGEPAGPVEGR